MSTEDDHSTAFLRQRRDLFVISAILLLIPIAEIEGAGNITMPFVGISMYIGKPEVITYTLWILWAYWYLRYYQAYMALNKGFLARRFNTEMARYLLNEFQLISRERLKELECKEGFEKEAGGYSYLNQNFDFFKARYEIKFSVKENMLGSYTDVTENHIFKGKRYVIYQIRAILQCCFKNIEVTEYLLPFLFGLAPVVYFIVDKFDLYSI